MAAHVGFRYRSGGPWVLKDVSLQARYGEVLCILGPNARGKTTLLSCLAGIHDPAEGTVERTGTVGFVPQSQASGMGFSVLDMVLMGRARKVGALRMPSRQDQALALACLERVGQARLADRPFSALSGGQRQLVLIARALASDCDTLILDEPTSALDLRNQGEVLRILRDFADEGMAILMTTHDPGHVLHVAERVLIMRDPSDPEATTPIVNVGETTELMTSEALTKLYRVRVDVTGVSVAGRNRTVVVPDFGRGVGTRPEVREGCYHDNGRDGRGKQDDPE